MSSVIWKAFKQGDLFNRNSSHSIKAQKKHLDESKEYDNHHTIKNITASKENNGCSGYLADVGEINKRKRSNLLTIASDAAYGGVCFFQTSEFVSTGHNNILEIGNDNLKKVLDKNTIVYYYLSKIITKTMHSDVINRFMRPIGADFDREIILLPVLEVSNNNEYIWEDNGKFWTLAVDYIKELMNEAKDRKEEKTIKLYEAEREKYEAAYFKEQSSLVWKAFKLEDLFETSTEHYLEKSKKNYNISDIKNEEYCVAVCAASKLNNGIVGYIAEVDDVSQKKRKGFITKGGFGHCFYQSDWFIKPGGSWGMLDIIKIKNNKFKKALDLEINCYYFLAKSLTKIFTSMASWGYAVPFNREIILLPVLEVSQDDGYIWEENGKFWILAINTVSYLYLQGQVNIQQRKIDTYTYKY